jgi:hypothetical protein
MQRAVSPSLAARLFGGDPAQRLALLRALWPQAVGPELARRSEVIGLEKGTLRVRVADARWRKEIHRMRADVLKHLRRLAGELTPYRMGLQEGLLSSPQDAARPPADEARPAAPLPPALRKAAEAIGDEEIRTAFIHTVGRALHASAPGKES